MSIEVKKFINRPFQVNSYLIYSGTEALIIDPGHECRQIISELEDNRLSPKGILLTHGHIDHIAGLASIDEHYPTLPIYLHEKDIFLIDLIDEQNDLFGLRPVKKIPIDNIFKSEDEIVISSFNIKPISTPGHSPGSVSFLIDSLLFSGDTLFASSIGRTDLYNGDYNAIIQSIKQKLFILPENTVVFPGHGPTTTIGKEKSGNPYLK